MNTHVRKSKEHTFSFFFPFYSWENWGLRGGNFPSHEDTGLDMCASYGSATFQLWLLIFANADPGRQHVMFQVHESIHTRDLDWVHDSRLEPGPVRAVAATWKVNQQIVAFYLTLLCLEIKKPTNNNNKKAKRKKHSSLELKGHFIPALSWGG